ncbi:hypothetical protein G4B88_027683 [Cannabis sativa]|uniref:Uncharacterized protein n=1 Tax=Cannabis sativa TaxID=3483 RepID=A0A7J6ERS8_CANSA|nr:hypothetical protein G4B88_027683 [Cannabis sativa]
MNLKISKKPFQQSKLCFWMLRKNSLTTTKSRIGSKGSALWFFKADDIVDEFNTQALRRQLIMPQNPMANKVRVHLFSSSNQLAFRFKMSRRIQGIKKKLASISNDKSFFLEQGRVETSSVKRVRETHSSVRHADVIGRDEDRSVIINKLLLESCEEKVSIMAIVGIGGLGKN